MWIRTFDDLQKNDDSPPENHILPTALTKIRLTHPETLLFLFVLHTFLPAYVLSKRLVSGFVHFEWLGGTLICILRGFAEVGMVGQR